MDLIWNNNSSVSITITTLCIDVVHFNRTFTKYEQLLYTTRAISHEALNINGLRFSFYVL